MISQDPKEMTFREFLENEGSHLAGKGENMQAVRVLFDAVYNAKYEQEKAV